MIGRPSQVIGRQPNQVSSIGFGIGFVKIRRCAVAKELEPAGIDRLVVAGELHRRAEAVA